MRKLIAIFLLAAFAVLHAIQVVAEVIPPIGLALGSPYQLIFVTADSTMALSSDISTYNAFVTAEAALNPSLPHGVTWDAVVSTAAVNAFANAPSLGLPIYNTAGQEVASAAMGLYSGSILNPVAYDQYGTHVVETNRGDPSGDYFVWTGSYAGGQAGYPLGSTNGNTGEYFGNAPYTDGTWITSGYWSPAVLGAMPVYALSSAIFVPEPASFTLLASALLLLGANTISSAVTIRLWQGQRHRRF